MSDGSNSKGISTDRQWDIYVLVFLVLGVLLMLANMCIIVLILQTPGMRQAHNVHIVHLTAADLLVGLGLVFWASTRIAVVDTPSGNLTNHWAELCTASLSLSMTSLVASVLILVIISIERYLKVTYPLRHMTLLSARALHWMRSACWFLAAVCGVLVVTTADYSPGQETCSNTAHTISIIILFSTALLILSFLHGSILRITFQQRRRIRGTQHHASGRTATRADRRLACMVALLFGLLYICWLPSLILSVAAMLSTNFDLDHDVILFYRISLILRYFSTAINPFIFNTFNADFRSAIRSKMAAACICSNGSGPKAPAVAAIKATKETRRF